MHYFPDATSCTYCINPFFIDPADLPVGTEEEEELINIQTDEAAKINFKECDCPINIWLSMESSYPNLATHAVPQLLIFPSTRECRLGFSSLMSIKSKSWNRLAAPGNDFKCAVSKVIPRIDQSVGKKQLHPSHQSYYCVFSHFLVFFNSELMLV